MYDVLIVSLTVAKGYRDRRRHRISGRNDLVGLIVRDGEPVVPSQYSWADLPVEASLISRKHYNAIVLGGAG